MYKKRGYNIFALTSISQIFSRSINNLILELQLYSTALFIVILHSQFSRERNKLIFFLSRKRKNIESNIKLQLLDAH